MPRLNRLSVAGVFGCAAVASFCFLACAPKHATHDPRIPTNAPSAAPYSLSKPIVEQIDPVNGVSQGVLTGIVLGDTQRSTLTMRIANLCEHTYITARAAREMGAVVVGVVELDPWDATPEAGSVGADGTVPRPSAEPGGKWNEDRAVAITGANPKRQRRFEVVRIPRVDLGVGPAFGPVEALVLSDDNSTFGLLGRSWLRHRVGNMSYSIFPDGLYWVERLAGTSAPN